MTNQVPSTSQTSYTEPEDLASVVSSIFEQLQHHLKPSEMEELMMQAIDKLPPDHSSREQLAQMVKERANMLSSRVYVESEDGKFYGGAEGTLHRFHFKIQQSEPGPITIQSFLGTRDPESNFNQLIGDKVISFNHNHGRDSELDPLRVVRVLDISDSIVKNRIVHGI